MLAGTDLGLALLYPGHSLHDEVIALVERAGLSPLDALRAATINGAPIQMGKFWIAVPKLASAASIPTPHF